MATVKDLKSMARTRAYEALRVIRDGKPTNESEYRRIIGTEGNALLLKIPNGRIIKQPLPRNSLVKVLPDCFVIYSAGYRDMTDDETAFIRQWMQHQKELREKHPEILLSVAKSDYFRNAGYEYLLGAKKVNGKKYDWKSNMIQDDSIQGDTMYLYKIRQMS